MAPRSVVLALVVGVVLVVVGLLSLSTNSPLAPPRTLPVPYTGDFRYASVGSTRFWCVAERFGLAGEVFARVRHEASGLSDYYESRSHESGRRRIKTVLPEERECMNRYGGDRPYGLTQLLTVQRSGARHRDRVSRLLGPEWRYEGIRGLREPDVVHVYSRFRVEPLDAPSPRGTSIIVDDVALPAQSVAGIRLVPDAKSTIRFQGPRGLIAKTSPPANPEDFADETAFTVRLGESVLTEGSPRVELHPRPPREGFGKRLLHWGDAAIAQLFAWVTSLLGLGIITTGG